MRSQKLIFIKCLLYFRRCSKHFISIPPSKAKHALSVFLSIKWGEKQYLLQNFTDEFMIPYILHLTEKELIFFYQKEDRITYKDSETEMNLLCSRQRKRPVWLIQYVYLNSSMCYLPEYYWLSVVSVLSFVKVNAYS